MTLSDVISKRTVFGKDAVLTGNASVSGNASTNGNASVAGNASITGSVTAKSAIVADNSSADAVRITQTGTGNALVVEDSTNPDATPFVVKADGSVGIGTTTPSQKLDVDGTIKCTRVNIINGVSGQFRLTSVRTNNLQRFEYGIDDNAESGSNAGSNFYIHRFNDAGAFVARVVEIKRSNGVISLNELPVYANNAAAIAGGLVANDVYKTATGELRIVV